MPKSIIPQNLWAQWWTRHVQIPIVQMVHPSNPPISCLPNAWTSDQAISTFHRFCVDLTSSHHSLQSIWTKRPQVSVHREILLLHCPSGAPLNGCETFKPTFPLVPEYPAKPSLNPAQDFSFVVRYSRATHLESQVWAEDGWALSQK